MAVGLRTARIPVGDRHALRSQHLKLKEERRAVRGVRTAVDFEDQRRPLFARQRRADEPAIELRAVVGARTIPPRSDHDLLLQPRIRVGDEAFAAVRLDESELVRRRRRRDGERYRTVIGTRKAENVPLAAGDGAHAGAVAREGAQAGRTFIRDLHDDLAIVVRPHRRHGAVAAAQVARERIADGASDPCGERTRRSARGRDDEQFVVETATAVVAVQMSDVGDLAAIAGEHRGRGRPEFARQLREPGALDVDHAHVSRRERRLRAVDARGEGELLSVW